MHDSESDCEISFTPPVYQQRYKKVLDLVTEFNPKKLVDFGCAECRLIRLLRNEKVEEIIGVDIDGLLLERHVESTRPLATEYLNPRPTPLTMRLFEGSISEYDSRLNGVDMITMIEVIEHLLPNILEEFPQIIFGILQPKVVVITTPNADFNVLFKQMKHGSFRHWDHKFEWTREEFKNWCEMISNKFKYTVTHSGIGRGPIVSERHGCCSQMAVFIRKYTVIRKRDGLESNINQQPYNVIEECVFPHANDHKMKVEKLLLLLKKFTQDVVEMYQLKYSDNKTYAFQDFANGYNLPSEIKYIPPDTGQFDDACDDSSTFEHKESAYFFKPSPYPQYKFQKNGYMKYLQNKYFNCRVDTVCTGQFENADEENCSLQNGLHCSFTYINDSVLYIPKVLLPKNLELKNFGLSYEEMMAIVNERSDVSVECNEEYLMINLNQHHDHSDHFSRRENSDSNFEENTENVAGGNFNTSVEEFFNEKWD